jgi:CheY-like chemotaxis protein
MSGSPDTKPVEILLVEDDLADIELTRHGLLDGKVANVLRVARDGVEALEMLRGEGGAAEAVRPDLILLDLNMPRMDGRRFLADLKSDEDLKDITVVILTTSVSDRDLVETFDLHPDAYMNKPVDFDGLTGVVQSIWNFWFMVVRKTAIDD